jgi:hypothetical protein
MVVLVTLVCAYAACWGPTKRRGFEDVNNDGYHLSETSDPRGFVLKTTEHIPAPLIVVATRIEKTGQESKLFRTHYLWFFGYVAKLPYERELD